MIYNRLGISWPTGFHAKRALHFRSLKNSKDSSKCLLFLSPSISLQNMDTVVSNSALLFIPPLPPVRTVTSNSYSPTTSALALSSKKLFSGFFYSSGSQRRQLGLRNSSSSARTVPKFTVASGGGIQQINETQFQDTVLNSDRPVLVEFVANWCGPCRLISPAMEWVAQVPLSLSLCLFYVSIHYMGFYLFI